MLELDISYYYRKLILFATIIKYILGTKLRVRKAFKRIKRNLRILGTDEIRTHDLR